MVLDADITKNYQSFNVLGHTASAIFSSRRPKKSILDKSIEDAEDAIKSLVETLERIDKKENDFLDEEVVDRILNPYTLGLEMAKPLVITLNRLAVENEDRNVVIFNKYNTLFKKFKEISETLEKIVFKLKDIKESIVSDHFLNLSISTSEDLWSEDEDEELRTLFLQS